MCPSFRIHMEWEWFNVNLLPLYETINYTACILASICLCCHLIDFWDPHLAQDFVWPSQGKESHLVFPEIIRFLSYNAQNWLKFDLDLNLSCTCTTQLSAACMAGIWRRQRENLCVQQRNCEGKGLNPLVHPNAPSPSPSNACCYEEVILTLIPWCLVLFSLVQKLPCFVLPLPYLSSVAAPLFQLLFWTSVLLLSQEEEHACLTK